NLLEAANLILLIVLLKSQQIILSLLEKAAVRILILKRIMVFQTCWLLKLNMMKSTKLILFIILLGFTAACNNDDDATANVNLTVNFTHNWDGEEVTSADFNTVNYENANGDILSITLLRYLISDIVLHKQD